MKRFVVVALVACACPSKQAAGPGSGSAVVQVKNPTTCADVQGKIAQLYGSDPQAADNVHMVMSDCAKDPAHRVPCIASAQTVAELEKQCLIPLDEEGTEGEQR